MRKGNYTIYGNKEYRFTIEEDNSISLISNDIIDLQKGFKKYAHGVYIKSVESNELKETYYVHPFALYKEEKFDAIVDEMNQRVNLGTGDADIARKLSFDRTDKYYYEKWVSIEDVELFEEKTEINL